MLLWESKSFIVKSIIESDIGLFPHHIILHLRYCLQAIFIYFDCQTREMQDPEKENLNGLFVPISWLVSEYCYYGTENTVESRNDAIIPPFKKVW